MHEDDVVDAMSRLLLERRGGIFNLTADGTMKLSEAAQIAGLKTRKMPLRGLPADRRRGVAAAPADTSRRRPGQIEFVRYPWIASNEKLKAELGWTPRYTSRETFEIAMRAKGMGAPAPAAADTGATAAGHAGGRLTAPLSRSAEGCRRG